MSVCANSRRSPPLGRTRARAQISRRGSLGDQRCRSAEGTAVRFSQERRRGKRRSFVSCRARSIVRRGPHVLRPGDLRGSSVGIQGCHVEIKSGGRGLPVLPSISAPLGPSFDPRLLAREFRRPVIVGDEVPVGPQRLPPRPGCGGRSRNLLLAPQDPSREPSTQRVGR